MLSCTWKYTRIKLTNRFTFFIAIASAKSAFPVHSPRPIASLTCSWRELLMRKLQTRLTSWDTISSARIGRVQSASRLSLDSTIGQFCPHKLCSHLLCPTEFLIGQPKLLRTVYLSANWTTISQDAQTWFSMQLAFAKFLSKIKGNF